MTKQQNKIMIKSTTPPLKGRGMLVLIRYLYSGFNTFLSALKGGVLNPSTRMNLEEKHLKKGVNGICTGKNFFYLTVFLMLFGIGQAPALEQEKARPFRIGAGLGCSFTGYRDETDLPVNRYLTVLNFIIDGNYSKDRFFYTFNFGFFTGRNNAIEMDSGEDFFVFYQRESGFIRVYLENALDYRLWGNQTFPGYLGGALRGDIYFVHLPQTIYYNVTGMVSLNIHATQKWIVNDNSTFIFSAGIPVFGYAVRPPYYGLLYSPFDITRGITSLHNYRAVFGDLKYHYKINSLISIYTALGFELSRIDFPQPRSDAAFRLNAGIAFAF